MPYTRIVSEEGASRASQLSEAERAALSVRPALVIKPAMGYGAARPGARRTGERDLTFRRR